jgi:hypothetical protein
MALNEAEAKTVNFLTCENVYLLNRYLFHE